MTDVYGTHENVVIEPFRDDLTLLKGIGATTAEKLYNAKVETIKQIAEMTPERLSETPGIGLVSATKFIAAAKSHLNASHKDNTISEPNRTQNTIKVRPVLDSIENYEVAEVIVEEINEQSQNEVEEDFEPSQTDEKWFSNKYNYSRLTASYPPISERVRNNEFIPEEQEFEQKDETVFVSEKEQSADEIDFDKEPEVEKVTEYDEEFTEDIILEKQIKRDQPEIEEVENKNDDVINPVKADHRSIPQLSTVFKDLGCYEIPRSLESLKQFTTNLDYLGCKLVNASQELKFIYLYPVKRFDQEGTVLVDEAKIELRSYSKNNHLGVNDNAEQLYKDLLKVRDFMHEDIANQQKIRNFFQKYLQAELRSEKGLGNRNLIFISGATHYKVVIEPILLCVNPPRSMEKSLVFPYQRSTNLHVVTDTDLAPLVKFLEKKYRMIEKRTKKSTSITDYRQAQEKFISRVRYVTIPIFGYSVTLLVVYFAELYFLLRLLNTIGFAVMGIFFVLTALLYFRAYKTKKKFYDQFETPYYLQNLEFSETDLLDFREDLTDELLTQFGYECLGKDATFGVIEQAETKSLKNNITTAKQIQSEVKTKFEFQLENRENVKKNPPTKYGIKYQDFLKEP